VAEPSAEEVTSGPAPILEVRDLTKDFPGVRALDGVSLQLGRGEILALCGENGAGKSTLIKVLSGIYPTGTYGGQIVLKGAPVRFASLREAEDHGIAVIAQELALVPRLSVAENLFLGRERVKHGLVDWKRTHDEARVALARVGLHLDPDTEVHELGVGQQQMVEIAKALAKSSEILILDEPTAALTETDAHRLLVFLGELRAHGVSCIYISHRLEEVFEIADRVTVMRDGRTVLTAPTAELDRDRVIAAMVGREVKDLYPRVPAGSGARLLSVQGWSVADPVNPDRFVVKDVSFDLHEGEVLGIAGLMGAGRTALVSSLFGAGRSQVRGRLIVAGRIGDAPFRAPAEAMAAGLALVSEDRKRYGLVLEATIRENMTLPTLSRFVRHLLLDHPARDRDSRLQFDALRVKAPGLHTRVGALSGGNQQKVVLGKWLMGRPRILFLDEPTRGIDVGAKAEIYELIAALARQGLGLVLVSSELPELLGMAERVVVLNQGRKTATLDRSAATPEAVMAAATVKV
jgi:D-xylose transport system ATP-binding protein